ncbi:type II secretion system GspH family protein [Aeromonas veronii]|uniref:PulJ/GspJ family protein n=1 Tax=Aeromonas caviae TaxID=648 RepID=UPI00244AD418|nr:type II secretion system protein [Aeromonas caviae]MDH1450851.1 type II secretion system GspH family protein [Aeromonas caviae]MDH1454761.1 type II secretion system GspH family protein [Aeromonas caviae]MDH1497671.1 type II secretion system GspH family protein [Aeromonas caviae]MEB8285109.1 type II secretion system GspH family protein [Aeromonas veronii]
MRQQGFSLLEAIVALTILAGATMALFGWIGGSLSQLTRAESYIEVAPALQSAVNYLKSQDLGNKAQGTFESGGVFISWHASPIEKERNGVMGSNFILSLYRVELTITRNDRTFPPLITRVVNYHLKPGVKENREIY